MFSTPGGAKLQRCVVRALDTAMHKVDRCEDFEIARKNAFCAAPGSGSKHYLKLVDSS